MPNRFGNSPNGAPFNPKGGKGFPAGGFPAGGFPAGSVPADQQEETRDVQDQAMETRQILVVNPDAEKRAAIRHILTDLRHDLVEAGCDAEAFTILASRRVDLVLVDLHVPEMGGIEFCETLRRAEATRLLPIFIQASANDQEYEARAIEAGADEFLISPKNPGAIRARVQASIRHKVMIESLDESESILFSVAKSVEERDPDLGLHCQRLALMGAAMGIALGLPAIDILNLQRGGYLHDIGKIGVPDRILFKPGPLSPDEWEVMKSHCERGERICSCMKSLAPVLPIIRHHHEKWDGSGYPDGLKGDQIPLLARIVQLADIYDALTTERPYKRAYSSEEAIGLIHEGRDKGWRDPYLVEVFSDLLPLFRNPLQADLARLSIQSLSASLQQYRKDALNNPNHAAGSLGAVRFIR
jgi:putative two-component system response regulator